MAVPERFRPAGEEQVESAVRVTPGTDTLTSLPVLIYEFDGEPPAAGSDFEYLPNFVATGTEEERGWAVAAPGVSGMRRWSPAEGALTPAQLLATVRSLREAAGSSLVHGDIRPQRILLLNHPQGTPRPDQEATIEGFGIPWQPDRNRSTAPEADGRATPSADVWALATTLQETGFEPDDATVHAVIEQCRAADPELRPTAEELAEALEQLLAPASGGAEEVPERERPSGPAEAAVAPRAAPPVVTGRVAAPADHAPSEPVEPAGGNRNRLVLVASLMAAVVILALLSFFWPDSSEIPANVTREATIYVVEVTVSPDDLPPVTVHLVSAPDGSSLEGGDRLGTAPRHLALDRAGTWAFRGSLGDRVSDTIEIQVPDERSLELTIPPATSGE